MTENLKANNGNSSLQYDKKEKKPSIIRKIFFNILGFCSGYYVGGVAVIIAKWLLFDLLGQMKILTTILSWPVDYGTYALTGVIYVDAFVSLFVCSFVTKFAKTEYKYSCFVLGITRILQYLINLIKTTIENGFSLSVIWVVIVSLGFFIMITFDAASDDC